MKTMRTLLLLLLLSLLAAVPAAFAQTWDYNINFNEYYANQNINALVVTSGPATFRGGKPTPVTNVPGKPVVYWTDTYWGNCNGCQNALVMEWTREVRNIQFMLINGVHETYGRTAYRLTDDLGHVEDFDMAGFYLENSFGRVGLGAYAAEVRWPYHGIRKLTLQSLRTAPYYNYSIDNVRFDISRATPTRVTAGYDSPASGGVNKLVPFQTVDAKFPLGSRFYLQLEEKRPDGSWVVVPSVMTSFQTTGIGINPKPYSGLLFNNHVAIPFDESSTAKNFHTFQAVHLGIARATLRPTTPNGPVTVNLTIDRPGALGSSGNALDKWFIDEAHKTGIPPQYFKGQAEQETSADPFNPLSFRYELKTRDVNLIQDPNHVYHHTKPPFVDYRMADGKKLCPAPPLPGAATPEKCPFPGLDDIFRRQRYKIYRGGAAEPRPIQSGDDPVTIRDIYNGHPNRVGLWGPDPAVRTGGTPGKKGRVVRSGPDPYNVIAQTTLASSYGVMQTVYTDMIDKPNNWKGVNGRVNPGLLFDTADNLNRGAGSIPLGALKGMRDWRRGNPNIDPTKPRFKTFADFNQSMRNMVAEYNPDPQYAGELMPRVPKYEPLPAGAIFAATCSAPSISSQSHSVTLPSGGEVALGVVASGGDLEYQWYRGAAGDTSNPIEGAFEDAVSVNVSGSTSFWAEVSNACGTAATTTINVSVGGVSSCSSPRLDRHPEAKTIEVGTSTTLSVAAAGSGLRYQWYVGIGGDTSPAGPHGVQAGDRSNPVGGATSPELTVQPLTNTDYWVLVSNSCGESASYSAKVTVTCTEPSISTPPVPATIKEGESAPLSVVASGSALKYQWYVGSAGDTSQPVSGGDSASIHVTPADSTTYWVRVSNPCGQKDSAPVLVTVEHCVKPTIEEHPQSGSIVEGDATTLTVTAAGTAPLAYQWFAGSTALTNATSPSLSVSPETATTYTVKVTNACGEITSNAATINVLPRCFRPIISVQPQPASIVAGQSTELSVTHAGTAPFTYQWYANGTAISGADQRTYTATPSVTTSYHVVITNDCGTATSAAAEVVVVEACDLPSIDVQPQPASILAGQATELSVTHGGTAPFTYRWYANGTAISGADQRTYTARPPVTTSYHVVITNDCGTATSAAAEVVVVEVCDPPAIDVQPLSVAINAGQQATVRVTASGTAPLSYQWFANGSAVSGANGNAFTVTPLETTTYYVEVRNACGTKTSSVATVTVNCAPPVMGLQPQPASIEPGQSVTLLTTTNGLQPFTWQWYANGSPVPLSNSSSLTVSPSTTTDYYVVVSNACGQTQSNTARVTVQSCIPARITDPPDNVDIAPGGSATLSVQTAGSQPRSIEWRNGAGSLIGTSSSVTVSPSADTTYTVRVSNACGEETRSVTVSIVDCPKPVITFQPKSFEVWEGNRVVLEVVASSATTLSYQWYANGVAMPGRTTRAIDVSPATVTTSYYVKVTNSCGTVQSNTATITVKPCTKPQIITQPKHVTITDGESATISVVASGTGPLSYELIQQDLTTAGSNSTGVFSVRPPIVAPATWDYWILVSNGCGSVMSQYATVTIRAACTVPAVTAQPQSVTIDAGQSATLTVAASGTAPLSIQWFTSAGAAVGSGTSLTVSPAQTTSYYARITNDCGDAQSATATVTVNQPCTPPSISSPTADTSILLRYGNSRSLSVTASGTDLQYQWYVSSPVGSSFIAITGARSSTLTVSPDDHSDYRVRVFNGCGDVTSPLFKVRMWDGIGDPPGDGGGNPI